MAALRRTLSPAFHEQNAGAAFTASAADALTSNHGPPSGCQGSLSPSFSSAASKLEKNLLLGAISLFPFSCLKLSSRRGMADKPLKSKGSLWKTPLFQLCICFFLGSGFGFFRPHSWPPSGRVETNHHGQQDIVFDAKSFPVGLQGEGIKFENMGVSDVERSMGEIANALEETSVATKLGENVGVDTVANLTTSMGNPDYAQDPKKLLIIVTPTYNRPFQAYYLTRLAHTLKLVPQPLLWLVVEMPAQSLETAAILRETGVMYRHLVCEKNLTNVKDRGTYQRNVALAHVEQHQLDGIIYFADDDNVYTLELFEQLRHIKRFGTWLVGMLAHSKSRTILEGPVCEGKRVIGWHTNEKSKRLRRFHVDMSGFGFNSTILWDPRRWRRPTLEPIRQLDTIKEGFQETTFIEQLVADESQMEGLPPGCSKVMVWHLHLEAASGLPYPSGWTLDVPLHPNSVFQ